MEPIKAARELGKAIQADERYADYYKARKVNDEDSELQEKIHKFNLARQNLGIESVKDDDKKDKEKIARLNGEATAIYSEIMENDNMKKFTAAKEAMDGLIHEVSEIISLCCDGEDPETCQVPDTSVHSKSNCSSGNCGGCSGCG